MKHSRGYPVFYMFVITAFLSSIVIGFAQFTRTRVEANELLSFERAVLSVLTIKLPTDAGGLEIHNQFLEKISAPDANSAGAFTLKEDGEITAYALPFAGQGFWAPIEGVIGFAVDQKTITGIYFYEQKETPGLGAQITTSDFRDQFKDKVISSEGALNFKRPGDILTENDVQAVTGATQTSIRLEKLLNDALEKWYAAIKENFSGKNKDK
jgi:Na+-transporting NADH:ubiquinone oxidoreductase subunit C